MEFYTAQVVMVVRNRINGSFVHFLNFFLRFFLVGVHFRIRLDARILSEFTENLFKIF